MKNEIYILYQPRIEPRFLGRPTRSLVTAPTAPFWNEMTVTRFCTPNYSVLSRRQGHVNVVIPTGWEETSDSSALVQVSKENRLYDYWHRETHDDEQRISNNTKSSGRGIV